MLDKLTVKALKVLDLQMDDAFNRSDWATEENFLSAKRNSTRAAIASLDLKVKTDENALRARVYEGADGLMERVLEWSRLHGTLTPEELQLRADRDPS